MTFSEIDFHPGERELRTFSVLWLVGLGLFGLLVAWRAGALGGVVPFSWQAPWRAPIALWMLAIGGSTLGLVVPRAIRPVYVAWMVAAFPVGWIVSLVLLAFAYYVVFSAFGLVFRLFGRDVLGRRFDRGARSYWVPRAVSPGLDRYFKQF